MREYRCVSSAPDDTYSQVIVLDTSPDWPPLKKSGKFLAFVLADKLDNWLDWSTAAYVTRCSYYPVGWRWLELPSNIN